MKSFRQYITEQEELEEKNFGGRLAALALSGAAVVSGLQAGATKHIPVPNSMTTSTSVETAGPNTKTTKLTRTGAVRSGENAGHIHRGFFDIEDKAVVDRVSKEIPATSSLDIRKTGPDGTFSASRKNVGGKFSKKTGNIGQTELRDSPTDSTTSSGARRFFKAN